MATTTVQNQSTPTMDFSDPHQGEIDQFNSEVKDVISQISNEWDAQANPAPEGASESDVPTEGEPQEPATDPANEQVAAGQEKPDEEDPAVKRGLDRLVAREVEIQAKESRANAMIAQAQAMMEKAKAFEGLKPVAELKEMITHSPSEVLKALGADPQEAIKLILAEQMGDKAPAELKEAIKDAAYRRKMAELERRLEEKTRSEQAVNYFNVVSQGAREYVKQVGDSTPTVKLVAAANPDRVHSEIMEELQKDAQARVTQDPNADLITYEEAAKRVEARWASIREVIQTNAQAATTNKTGAKTTPPTAKPPSKPLAPWKNPTGKELENKGIEDAMKEFARLEGQKPRF
jgi:hypothetical protein